MIFKSKNKFKPLYKKFLLLKENIQNRRKLLKFKKQKWKKLIQNYKNKLQNYKKFKPKDQAQYLVSQYPNKADSYKRRYENTLRNIKKLKTLYGGLSKKFIKKTIKKTLNIKYKKVNSVFLKLFETRLDTTLYRAKFSPSIRNAQQLILHNKILVNNKPIRIKSYLLQTGDLITVDSKYINLIKTNVQKSEIWPIPPKHLTINYKTLQIVFGTFENTNFSLNFLYHLNLEKILTSYHKH